MLGLLALVFLVILPQAIDYRDVASALARLDLAQAIVLSALGLTCWVLSGLVIGILVGGLSVRRATMSWLINSGIGSSIPFGPWNLGVLWFVMRGWGIGNAAATSGIALYGIANTLSLLVLPLLAVAALTIFGPASVHPTQAWILALGAAGIAVLGMVAIMAIVGSERIAHWIGRTGQRLVDWLLHLVGRTQVPNVERSVLHFRTQLGTVIQRRGLAALLLAFGANVAWAILFVAALRLAGVDSTALPVSRILAVFSAVSVAMILPIAPGGAGIPEVLFIGMLTSLAPDVDPSALAAGVLLYRVFNWFLPIPLAWIMLKASRLGRSTLPSTAELRAMATDSP